MMNEARKLLGLGVLQEHGTTACVSFGAVVVLR
jgi:hypothetical protein